MPKIRQKINRKKDCFLEYKIIDFNIILRDSPYMFNNKKESRNMTKTKKAIDKLNQIINDYINIFDTDKKEIKEIEQSLEILIKKINQ